MKPGFCGNAKPNAGLPCRAKMMTPGRARSCARVRPAASPAQGWGASRGIKEGSAPLASSYRGPDNVAGPILGHLNPALAVVSTVPGNPSWPVVPAPATTRPKSCWRSANLWQDDSSSVPDGMNRTAKKGRLQSQEIVSSIAERNQDHTSSNAPSSSQPGEAKS